MTSLLQKINELDLRIDNISTSGGTTDTTALQNQIDINTTDISGLQTNKQNTLIPGDNITIVGNTISSSSSSSSSSSTFVGFRVEMSQEKDTIVLINALIPFNAKTGNTGGFVYDTHNMFNTSTYKYTIPTGYSGYWTFNMKLFVAEYAENFRRIHLRITRGTTNYDPLQIGNYYSQVDILNGTIPVLEGDSVYLFVSNGGNIKIYASRDNCWFEGRYLGPL